MEIIDVLVYAEKQFADSIFMPLRTSKNIGKLENLSGIDDIKDKISKGGNFVVIVEEGFGESEFIDYLRHNQVRHISIIENKRDMLRVLSSGASDVLVKSEAIMLADFCTKLLFKIRTIGGRTEPVTERVLKKDYGTCFEKIIAIGSSTGGTEAVLEVLRRLPENFPPVLVVQHMPEFFTKIYAAKLNSDCQMSVWEAKDGDLLRNGLCLLAPGKKQMSLNRTPDGFHVKVQEDWTGGIYIPSVDVLFDSVAKHAGAMAIGVILTGMGKDGAEGMLNMRKTGAFTIGQNEETSVVYGMPKAAYDIGAVDVQENLQAIADLILKKVGTFSYHSQ